VLTLAAAALPALFLLPAPEAFVHAATATPLQGRSYESLATLLSGSRPGLDVEPARIPADFVPLRGGDRLVSYARVGRARAGRRVGCGLLVVRRGRVAYRRALDACTSWRPPALVVDPAGAAWVTWERDYREVVVERVSRDLRVEVRTALPRPRGRALEPLVSLSLREDVVRLAYGAKDLVELDAAGRPWPDGMLSRAALAVGVWGRAASLVGFALAVLLAAVAVRWHRVGVRLGGPNVLAGRIAGDGARPRLVTDAGEVLGVALGGAHTVGDPNATRWLVAGPRRAAGAGAFRATDEIEAEIVVCDESPLEVVAHRRNRAWALALGAWLLAAVPWLAAALI
jgi:hypothetical protein